MFRRSMTIALALVFMAGGTWADDNPPSDLDDANDALQGKDKAKSTDDDMEAAGQAARGGDASTEEEIDPIQALNDIADKMKEAEAALLKAGSYREALEKKKAIEAQKKAAEDIEKLIRESKENQGKSAEEIQKLIDEATKKMEQAIDDATKLMTGAGNQQKKALEEIERLIKQAKESG